MKRPAVFFDRDNTLIVSDGYLADPADVRLVGGAAQAVARARALGFCTVTISNQSGVARGLYSEKTVEAINARMDELLAKENPGAIIDRHEYCPFHPQAVLEQYRRESELRKPKPGMILRAAEALQLDLGASWVIGDAPRDIQAGCAAGCRTILVRDASLPASPAATEEGEVDPDRTVANLGQAIKVIESAAKSAPASPASPDKLESLAREILDQLKRRHAHPMDFSLGKLLAGVTQALAIAAAVGSYFYKPGDEPTVLLLAAIFLQLLTLSLLAMGRER